MSIISQWIENKAMEIGIEDEVIVEFVIGLIEQDVSNPIYHQSPPLK